MSSQETRYFGKKSSTVLMISLFLLLLFLRIYRLGYHDFWYDEVMTLYFSTARHWTANPPLYYILIFLWGKIFGTSEYALRFPSVIFSALSLGMVYLLGKELFGRKAGLLASVIMGLSPFQLWYAQEARNYSMLLLLSTVSSYFLLKAVRKEKRIFWLLFSLISVTGLYTHYLYIFLILSQLTFALLIKKRKGNFLIITVSLGTGLLFTPYLARFLTRFQGGYWINVPDWQSLLFTFENLMLGYHGTTQLYTLSNIVTLGLFIFSLNILRVKRLRSNYLFCILLFFIPLFTVFFFSKYVFSVYLDRGFIVISPYCYLILSSAIIAMPKKVSVCLLGGLLFLLLAADCRYFKDKMVPSLKHHNGLYTKKPLKPLAQFLDKNVMGNKEALFITNPSGWSVIAYCPINWVRDFYIYVPGIRDEETKKPYLDDEENISCYRLRELDFQRFWVIASDWGRTGALDDNSQRVKEWLDDNFILVFSNNFEGTWLFGYIKKQPRPAP